MSIWEAFGMGRHKGFSREAGLLLDEAVELAGSMGCARADTGHLLLAMLQTDRGPAGRFLAGKNITEPAGGAAIMHQRVKWLLFSSKVRLPLPTSSISGSFHPPGPAWAYSLI